ncbi:MAG: transcriptional repressor LexA, partial [Clostridia bacterium]
MMDLTEREKQVLDFIENAIKNDGYAPSVRDICAALCIKSTSTVHMYMQRLDQKGYIKKDQNKSRAISIDHARISPDEKMLRVPLLGKVRAGTPITAVQNYDGYVDFPSSMAHKKNNLFALRIIGESMREAGIMDGDIVVVEGCK